MKYLRVCQACFYVTEIESRTAWRPCPKCDWIPPKEALRHHALNEMPDPPYTPGPSDRIDWPKFNPWVRQYVSKHYPFVEETRPIIFREDPRVHLLVAYRQSHSGNPIEVFEILEESLLHEHGLILANQEAA